MAKGNILRIDKVLSQNVHKVHFHLAHSLDKAKLKSSIRKGGNTVEL